MNNQFETQKHVEHWMTNSDDDYETMLTVYQARKYSWSLFIGHLVIEKLLKALYVSVKEETPPFIHNLVRLAEQTGLEIDDKLLNDLTTISAFNINARYDDYKNSFKKICTEEFTTTWVRRISELRTWIKEQMKI